MLNTILSVLPIFLLILTGHVLKRNFLEKSSFWNDAEKLTYYILLPCLLVLKLSLADFSSIDVSSAILLSIAATLLIGLMTFFAKWIFKIEDSLFTSIFQGSTRYNSYVFLGMSASIFGETGIALCGIFIAHMIITTNILSVIVLNQYGKSEKKSLFSVLEKILKNPLILGSLVGIILNVFNIQTSQTLTNFMEALGGAASPLSLLAVGAGLKFSMNSSKLNAVSLSLIFKLIALPVVTIGLIQAFDLSGDAISMALLYACLPCAGNSYILARQMGGDAESMASIITFTTLGAGITTPFILQFYL